MRPPCPSRAALGPARGRRTHCPALPLTAPPSGPHGRRTCAHARPPGRPARGPPCPSRLYACGNASNSKGLGPTARPGGGNVPGTSREQYAERLRPPRAGDPGPRSGATSTSPWVWIGRSLTLGVWPVQNFHYLGSLARSKFQAVRASASPTIQSGSGGSGTVLPASEFVLSARNWIFPARMNVWQTALPAPVS